MSEPKYKTGTLLQRQGSEVCYMITESRQTSSGYVYDLSIMSGLPGKQYQELTNIREALLVDNAVLIVNKT